MKKEQAKSNANMATGPETCFANPGSIFAMVDKIMWAIASAKHNKTYVLKFVTVVKQITKVLNGVDADFIRHAEFYSDLKATLNKIEQHIRERSTRGKWVKKLMAKKDQKTLDEIEEHVDLLITRIVFSFAQRVEMMNIARQKAAKKRRNFSVIEEEDETEISQSETSSMGDESTSFSTDSSEDEVTGER